MVSEKTNPAYEHGDVEMGNNGQQETQKERCQAEVPGQGTADPNTLLNTVPEDRQVHVSLNDVSVEEGVRVHLHLLQGVRTSGYPLLHLLHLFYITQA